MFYILIIKFPLWIAASRVAHELLLPLGGVFSTGNKNCFLFGNISKDERKARRKFKVSYEVRAELGTPNHFTNARFGSLSFLFSLFASVPINFEHRQLRGGGGFDGPVVGEHGKQFQYDSLSRGEFWCWGQ
jgi:hypothetical protein